MRMQVQPLALLTGLGIQCCLKLWCRSQMWIGSRIAVAVGRLAAKSPVWPLVPLAWGNSIYLMCCCEKGKKKKKSFKKVMHLGPSLCWWNPVLENRTEETYSGALNKTGAEPVFESSFPPCLLLSISVPHIGKMPESLSPDPQTQSSHILPSIMKGETFRFLTPPFFDV